MKTLNKAVARYNGISLIVRILIGLFIGQCKLFGHMLRHAIGTLYRIDLFPFRRLCHHDNRRKQYDESRYYDFHCFHCSQNLINILTVTRTAKITPHSGLLLSPER